MDMATSTTMAMNSPGMSMGSMSTSASPTSTGMGMGGMGMDMGMGGPSACKISMTWNWYTVGACFISKEWRITSSGMFAGSCIGVILLVISLEFLRRAQREFDGFIAKRNESRNLSKTRLAASGGSSSNSSSNLEQDNNNNKNGAHANVVDVVPHTVGGLKKSDMMIAHVVRSLLHMLQFGVAYFVMLLAMYYNGYLIICILIGAFLGALLFAWDQTVDKLRQESADVTGCCG